MNYNEIVKKVEDYNNKRKLIGKRACCYTENGRAYFDIGRADNVDVKIPDFIYGIVQITDVDGDNDQPIESIEFSSNVKFVGNGAFYCLSRLKLVSDMDKMTDVTKMINTFAYCESLVKAPKLPESAVILDSVFSSCSSLTEAPEIPNNAICIDAMFDNCTSLEKVGVIPNSVQKMNGTFRKCEALKNVPKIPDSVRKMNYTFENCISLEKAPIIPENVEDISGIFRLCKALKGVVTINTDTDNNRNCLYGTILPIQLEGKSKQLNRIVDDTSKIIHSYKNLTVL